MWSVEYYTSILFYSTNIFIISIITAVTIEIVVIAIVILSNPNILLGGFRMSPKRKQKPWQGGSPWRGGGW